MKNHPKLSKSDTEAYAHGADAKVTLLGKFQATESKLTTVPFYNIQGNSGNLLSYMTVDLQVISEIHSLETSKVDYLCQKY